MEAPTRNLFAARLDDPWSQLLAARVGPRADRVDTLAEALAQVSSDQPAVIVWHATSVEPPDLEALRKLSLSQHKLIVVAGPHVRYQELRLLEQSAAEILADATAPDVIAWRFVTAPSARPGRPALDPIRIVAADHAARSFLSEAIVTDGHRVRTARDWPRTDAAPPNSETLPIALWVIPVLEAGWPAHLRRLATRYQVVALLGLPDRATASLARSCGAAACLDLSGPINDLRHTIDRLLPPGTLPHPPAMLPPPHHLRPTPVVEEVGGSAASV